MCVIISYSDFSENFRFIRSVLLYMCLLLKLLTVLLSVIQA